MNKWKFPELSNLMLMAPFIYALYKPENNIDFIYDRSIMLFIVEFLSIPSSEALSGISSKDFKTKIPLILFYLFLVGTLLAITKSPQIFYFSIVSFITKFFIHRKSSVDDAFVKPLLVLISSVFLVVFFSGLLKIVIPLPDYILMQKPGNASGLFVEVPQTILAWGIIYPVGLYLISFFNIPIQKSSRSRS